jgi:GT2 family glycosyltransferase
MLIEADAVRSAGLPVAAYFLWNDDFEFSARLLRRRRGIYVPASIVTHKTKAKADTDNDPGERFYFEVRNKIWLFRFSSALAWYERPLYLAATVRRWLRTYVSSRDKATISRTFWRGISDGLTGSPESNSVYLGRFGVDARILSWVAAVERDFNAAT